MKNQYRGHCDEAKGFITVHDVEYVRQTKDNFILSWGGALESYPKNKCNYNVETKQLFIPRRIMQKKFPETNFDEVSI